MSWSCSTFRLKTLPRTEKLVWPFLGHRWGDSWNDWRGKGTLHESLLFVLWQTPSPNHLLHQLSFPSAALWPWENMSSPRCGLHLLLSAEIDYRGYSVDPTNLNRTGNSCLYGKKNFSATGMILIWDPSLWMKSMEVQKMHEKWFADQLVLSGPLLIKNIPK